MKKYTISAAALSLALAGCSNEYSMKRACFDAAKAKLNAPTTAKIVKFSRYKEFNGKASATLIIEAENRLGGRATQHVACSADISPRNGSLGRVRAKL